MLDVFRWTALAAAIVLIVAFAGAIVFSSQQSAIPTQQQYSEKNHEKQTTEENYKTLWDRWFPESISLYTLFLAVFTAVLAGGGLIQLNLLGRAERIAAVTAQAAKDAADAAKQSSDATIALERPRLFIAELKLIKSSETDPKPKISYSITNLGRVTAGIRLIYADAMLKNGWGPPARYKQQRFLAAQQPVTNGATIREHLFATFDTDLVPQDYIDIANGAKSVLVQFMVVYGGPLNFTYTVATTYLLDVKTGLNYATGGDDYNFEKTQDGRAATLHPDIQIIPAPPPQQAPAAK
jgi:hypothetical protein